MLTTSYAICLNLRRTSSPYLSSAIPLYHRSRASAVSVSAGLMGMTATGGFFVANAAISFANTVCTFCIVSGGTTLDDLIHGKSLDSESGTASLCLRHLSHLRSKVFLSAPSRTSRISVHRYSIISSSLSPSTLDG